MRENTSQAVHVDDSSKMLLPYPKCIFLLVCVLHHIELYACQYGQTGDMGQMYQNGRSISGQSGYPHTSQYGQQSQNRYNEMPLSSQYGQRVNGNQYASQQNPYGQSFGTGQGSYGSQVGRQQNPYGHQNSYGQQKPYGTQGSYGQQSAYGQSYPQGQTPYGTGQSSLYPSSSAGSYLGSDQRRSMNPYGSGYMGTGENAIGRSLYERGVTPQSDVMGGSAYGTGLQSGTMPFNGNGCRQIILAPYAKFLYGRPCDGSIGSRCYLTCEPGFDLIGSCFRVCGTDRRWSGSEMLCVRPAITCPSPNFNSNIRIIAGCQNMAGFSCTLGCKSGGTPSVGGIPLRNGMIYCQVEGRWSQEPASITCGAGGGISREGSGFPQERGAFGNDRTGSIGPERGIRSGTELSTGNEMARGETGLESPMNTGAREGVQGGTAGAINGFVEEDSKSISAGKFIYASSPVRHTDRYHHNRFYFGDDREVRSSHSRLSREGEDETDQIEWDIEASKNKLQLHRMKRAPTQVTCEPLNPPKNGQSSGQCAPGFPGRACRFNCIQNYTRRGEASITCGLRGEWSSPQPRCVNLSKGDD